MASAVDITSPSPTTTATADNHAECPPHHWVAPPRGGHQRNAYPSRVTAICQRCGATKTVANTAPAAGLPPDAPRPALQTIDLPAGERPKRPAWAWRPPRRHGRGRR